MTDIVERLRRLADMTTTDNDLSVIAEAADEIERLRAAVEHLEKENAVLLGRNNAALGIEP